MFSINRNKLESEITLSQCKLCKQTGVYEYMAARLYECMAASRYNLAPSRERMALKLLHDVVYKAQRKS